MLGRGAEAHEHINYVFPNAPAMNLTLLQQLANTTGNVSSNSSFVVNTWYDISAFDFVGNLGDDGHLNASLEYVHGIIDEQERLHGIPPERVVVGGFSQGGNVAIKAFGLYPRPLAGCVALSAWLEPSFILEALEVNKARPIFWGHGENDTVSAHRAAGKPAGGAAAVGRDPRGRVPRRATDERAPQVVPAFLGRAGVQFLLNDGFGNVTSNFYRGLTHSYSDEELADVKAWVDAVIPPL